MLRQKIADNWQWAGLYLVLILASIYSRPLIPIDETRYLSVAWEMWHNQNFLVPHINGHPYSHKPPLLFWLINLSWQLFGVNEWSARLVGPLFGFGSIILTVRLAEILWPANRGTRLAAPFILLSTVIWSLYSTLTMFDTLLTFMVLLFLICLLAVRRNTVIFPWIGLSLTIGLGILAKGPIVLLYVLPPLLLAPLWSDNNNLSWKRWYFRSLLSIITGIAIALCWAIPAALAGGKEYQQAILFSQTAGRMVNAFAHGRAIYWYALLLPLLVLPWFFWVPAWRGWQKKSVNGTTRFCFCMVFPAFFLLSCVSGKQIHYVLPLLPVVALLIAHAVTTVPKRTQYDHMPLLLIFLMLSVALAIAPQLPMQGGDREMLQYIPRWLAVVPFGAAIFLYRFRAGSILKAIKIVTTAMVMLVILLQLGLSAPLHAIYDQSVIANKISQAQLQNQPVAVFPDKLADQFHFAGRLKTPLVAQPGTAELAEWAIENRDGLCLLYTKSKNYKGVMGKGAAYQYDSGWLIFRPAKDYPAGK